MGRASASIRMRCHSIDMKDYTFKVTLYVDVTAENEEEAVDKLLDKVDDPYSYELYEESEEY